MGASRKWLKTIVSKKLSAQGKNSNHEQSPPKKWSKWNLLKSRQAIDKGSILGGGEDDDIENGGNVLGDNAKASQMVLSQAELEEWAVICIQTAFRGYLARRTLRALKGLVRLQATMKGHNVQKQSIGSLHSIQAFVRMQARIRAHRALKKKGIQGTPVTHSSHTVESRSEESEDGWCDTMGTVEEIQARAQQRQEAAIKRERAMAYAFSNQWQPNSRSNLESLFDYELDESTWNWIWLDRWINNQPNPLCKPGAQAIEDTKGKNFAIKKSSSHKSPNSKLTLDTPKGNYDEYVTAGSHGAGTGDHLSVGNKPNGKKQAGKVNAQQSSKQREWRSFSNPKQRPSRDVKRKYSLPSPVCKLQTDQTAVCDKVTNGITVMAAAPEEKKDDIVHSQAK